MATTLTSSIINVNISKLKRDLEALGDIKVKKIQPKDGATPTTIVLTRGDGITNLTPAQETSAQAVIDAHVDTQQENIKLKGQTSAIFGVREATGTITFQKNDQDTWKIDASNHLIPFQNAAYNVGSATNRINQLWATSANLSGDLTVSGNLTVDGTLTYLNTTNLDISDNEITLNADWVGAPTQDAGIRVERGSSTDALIRWNETLDKWQAGDESDQQNLIRQVEFDTHVNNTSNPHSVTKAQVGLGSVTDDAQLKRAAGDFVSFANKTVPVNADVFLIEDSAAAGAKKHITFLQLNQQLVHQNLSGAGTNTHAQIDTHIASTSNPHNVTKAQVGLGNVTDDEQLKRAANDFISFTAKIPTTNDVLLVEDTADNGNKKYITIGNLPFTPANTLDGFPLPAAPANGQTIVFDGANNEWDYIEEGVAKKIRAYPIELGVPNDGEYLKYDAGLDEFVYAPAPGISSSGPIGSILPFGGGVVPSGFLLCDGSAVSRIFYQDLFAIIGTTFGPGDGSTTFNLPDLRQRFPLGKAASGTGATLGSTGGAIDHTHIAPAHTHDMGNHTHTGGLHTHDMQNHTHSVPAHYHGLGSGADLNITASGSHIHGTSEDIVHHTPGTGTLDIGPGTEYSANSINVNSANHTHNTPSFSGHIGLVTGGVDGNSAMTSGAPSTNLTSSDGAVPTSGPSTNLTSSAGNTATSSNNPPFQVVNYIIKYSDNLLATGVSEIANVVNFSNVIRQQTHAGFPNSHRISQTFGKQTTTNSTETLGSVTINDNSVAWFSASVVARLQNTSVNKSAWAFIRGAVRRNNGGSAILVDLPEIVEGDEGSSGYVIDVDVSANDLRIRITGANGETVNWSGTLEFQHVSLAS